MRHLFFLSLLCLSLLRIPVMAQGQTYPPNQPYPAMEPFVLDFELVHTKTPPSRRILDSDVWRKEVQSGRFTVLESGRTIGSAGMDSLGHIGSKRPIAYFDPRVGASQVQYTDLGFKADWKPSPLPDGTVEIEIRMEKGQLVKPDLPTSTVFIQEANVFLRRGQTAVLASTRGVLTAKYFGTLYPEVSFGEDSAVMLVISLK